MINLYIVVTLVASALYLIPERPPNCKALAAQMTSTLDIEHVELERGEESYSLTIWLDSDYTLTFSFSPSQVTHQWYLTRGFVNVGQCVDDSGDVIYIGQRTDSREIN